MRPRRDGGPGGGHRGACLVGAPEQAADAVVKAGQRDDRHNGDDRYGQHCAGGQSATVTAGLWRGRPPAGPAKATKEPGGVALFEQ